MSRHLPGRRSLFAGLGAAAAAVLAAGAARLQAQTSAGGFEPARHDEDQWMDQLPGRHRVFVDTSSTTGGTDGVRFASNLFNVNRDAYGLASDQVAIIVCFRHISTPFGFTDEIWADYGDVFNERMQLVAPGAGQAPRVNPQTAAIAAHAGRGGQFAVCRLATRALARRIAQARDLDQEAVFDRLVAGAVPNARFVPAGVAAATRSQEYGYSLLTAG